MAENKPTFPSDFRIETFNKIDERKQQRIQDDLLKTELYRIYNLVMDREKRMSDTGPVTAKFGFNYGLSKENKKYLLTEIRQRFPRIKYMTGSSYDKETDSMQYSYHEINSVTDEDINCNPEYIIDLR